MSMPAGISPKAAKFAVGSGQTVGMAVGRISWATCQELNVVDVQQRDDFEVLVNGQCRPRLGIAEDHVPFADQSQLRMSNVVGAAVGQVKAKWLKRLGLQQAMNRFWSMVHPQREGLGTLYGLNR
jgi:hypothetical protein